MLNCAKGFRLGRAAAPVIVWLAVALTYLFIATGGTWWLRYPQGDEGGGLDELARRLLDGRVDLEVLPQPELLVLPDPYNPVQNFPYRLHDVSLYLGHYFYYSGPPSVLPNVLWRIVTRSAPSTEMVHITAGLVASIAFALIVTRLRKKCFPKAPSWWQWCSVIGFALGGPMLYLIGRPIHMYHQPILVGVALVVSGWYFLQLGLEETACRRVLLATSGLLLGLAVGCRLTFVGYAMGVILPLAWPLICPRRGGRRAAIRDLVSFCLPLLLVAGLLGWYDYVRFDNPFETGWSYQLHGSSRAYEISKGSGSTQPRPAFSNLPLNFTIYLLAVPRISPEFPFFGPDRTSFSDDQPADPNIVFPPIRIFGTIQAVQAPLVGLALLYPAVVLAPLASFAVPRIHSKEVPPAQGLVIAVVLGTLATCLLLSTFYFAHIRYLGDLWPGVMFMTAVGLAKLAVSAKGRLARRTLLAAATASTVSGVVFGLLLGIYAWTLGYGRQAEAARSTVADLKAALPVLYRGVPIWRPNQTLDLYTSRPDTARLTPCPSQAASSGARSEVLSELGVYLPAVPQPYAVQQVQLVIRRGLSFLLKLPAVGLAENADGPLLTPPGWGGPSGPPFLLEGGSPRRLAVFACNRDYRARAVDSVRVQLVLDDGTTVTSPAITGLAW